MSATVCALLELEESAAVSRVVASGRYRYTKNGHVGLIYVIADIGADGREDFAEQESGELRWHSFTPSAEERQAMLAHVLPNSEEWRHLRFDRTERSR